MPEGPHSVCACLCAADCLISWFTWACGNVRGVSDTPRMETLMTLLTAVVSGLVVSVAAHRMSRRASDVADSRAIRREAAADLSATIRDLRSVTRQWGRVPVTPDEVVSAVEAWSEAHERLGHRLPPESRHLGRSVRAAVGEVFGGVTLADLRPDMAAAPLADPDFEWQEFADEYLSYAVDRIVRWGDGDISAGGLLHFDAWLKATARRDVSPL